MKQASEYAAKWLGVAAEDLATANALSQSAPRHACYHYQQAIEKFLKAYLVLSGFAVRKTHIIPSLILSCEELVPGFNKTILGLTPEQSEMVTDWATIYRYPGDEFDTPILPADLSVAREAAQRLNNFVESAILDADHEDDRHTQNHGPKG